MQEQLISFETAKLAKEKGFDWKKIEILEVKSKSAYLDSTTQSLLQKWLREKHNIHIEVHSRHSSWIFFIFELSNWNRECLLNIDWYGANEYLISKNIPTILKTYEEALETGLQQALTLIKK